MIYFLTHDILPSYCKRVKNIESYTYLNFHWFIFSLSFRSHFAQLLAVEVDFADVYVFSDFSQLVISQKTEGYDVPGLLMSRPGLVGHIEKASFTGLSEPVEELEFCKLFVERQLHCPAKNLLFDRHMDSCG